MKKYGYFSNLRYVLIVQWQKSKRYVIGLIAQIPTSVLVSVISAFIPKIVLDSIEEVDEPIWFVMKICMLIFVLILIQLIEHILNAYNQKVTNLSRIINFQMPFFNKLMTMDYCVFVDGQTRIKKEKALAAIRNGKSGVSNFLKLNKDTFSALTGFVSFTVIIANCNIIFIPIIIATYSISALGWFLLQKYNDSQKDERAKTYMKLSYVTFRSKDLSSAKDIRVYDMLGYLMNKIDFHLKENMLFDIKKNNGHFINVTIEDCLKFILSLGAYLYLVKIKISSDMTLGDFSLYFGAITGFGSWLSKLVDSFAQIIESSHYISDYRMFMDIPDTTKIEYNAPPFSSQISIKKIEVNNLTFSYDEKEKPILQNISFDINSGERIAIIGVNGAGKSTLVKLICGLLSPDKGKIYINGIDSVLYNKHEYYKLFSTVFQDMSILPMSIARNIALCEDEQIDRDRVKQSLLLSGLYDKISQLPQKEDTLLVSELNDEATTLSGGEIQKLMLARALYKDAPIVILDEPTASLDPIAENEVYQKYEELTKGKISIFISHRLASTKFCDKIILLDSSKILEMGTHDELIKKGGKYAEMFINQSRYYISNEDSNEKFV